MAITRILVPTDFSDAAACAVDYGCNLADAVCADLCLLHIVVTARRHAWIAQSVDDELEALTGAWLIDARQTMGRLIAAANERIAAVRGVVRLGLEVEEILNCARDERADLIVMGMHGHGGAARWQLGSVTDRVLRKSPCPVLAIPAGVYAASEIAVEQGTIAARRLS